MTDKEIEFEKELTQLINRHSMESYCGNTPDFLIAQHLMQSMKVLALTIFERDRFYDNSKSK